MKEWSQPQHNNVVVVSEYKGGGEEWKVIADHDWEAAKLGKKQKKKKKVRRHSSGRPTEKLFVWAGKGDDKGDDKMVDEQSEEEDEEEEEEDEEQRQRDNERTEALLLSSSDDDDEEEEEGEEAEEGGEASTGEWCVFFVVRAFMRTVLCRCLCCCDTPGRTGCRGKERGRDEGGRPRGGGGGGG
jgi:hypothetical protein